MIRRAGQLLQHAVALAHHVVDNQTARRGLWSASRTSLATRVPSSPHLPGSSHGHAEVQPRSTSRSSTAATSIHGWSSKAATGYAIVPSRWLSTQPVNDGDEVDGVDEEQEEEDTSVDASSKHDGKSTEVHSQRHMQQVVRAWFRNTIAFAGFYGPGNQSWGEACFFLDHPGVPKHVRMEAVWTGTDAPSSSTLGGGVHWGDLNDLPVGTVTTSMLAGAQGTDVNVIGGSFNLYMQCIHDYGDFPVRLSAKDLVQELFEAFMVVGGEGKHQVMVVCSTQPPDDDVQQLLDTHHATNVKAVAEDSKQQQPYEMAVLQGGSSTTVGPARVTIPPDWTLVVLGLAASREVCRRGIIAKELMDEINERYGTRH